MFGFVLCSLHVPMTWERGSEVLYSWWRQSAGLSVVLRWKDVINCTPDNSLENFNSVEENWENSMKLDAFNTADAVVGMHSNVKLDNISFSDNYDVESWNCAAPLPSNVMISCSFHFSCRRRHSFAVSHVLRLSSLRKSCLPVCVCFVSRIIY